MENNTGKYFKYAIGEIVLVVIGILIALQINNWNETNKKHTVSVKYLENLKKEVALNESKIKKRLKQHLFVFNKTSELLEFMENDTVRHMPVIKDKKAVGIISDRDLKYFQNKEWAKKLNSQDIMNKDPYIVNENESLLNVVQTMEEKKYGCALVCDTNNELTGIFTTIDALKLLKGYLS